MRKGENFFNLHQSFLKNIIALEDLGMILDAQSPVLSGLSFLKVSVCLWTAQSFSRSQGPVFCEVIFDSS